MRSNIYSSIPILDMKEFHKYEEELVSFNGYLPCLLRRLCNPVYYKNIYNLYDNNHIYIKIYNSRDFNREEIVTEFLEWCKLNNYTNLIKSGSEKELSSNLDKLDKEFEYVKRRI